MVDADVLLLDALADGGLTRVGGDELGALADWCWDMCEETGSGVYGSLSVTLRRIDRWWSEYSAIPASIFSSLDELLRRRLPAVLTAEDPRTASHRARSLRLAVEELLVPPEEWPSTHE